MNQEKPGQLIARLITAHTDIVGPLQYIAGFTKDHIIRLRAWFESPASLHTRLTITPEMHENALKRLQDIIDGFATLQDLNIHLNGFMPVLEPVNEFKIGGTNSLAEQRERLRQMALHNPNKIAKILIRCCKCGIGHPIEVQTNGLAAWLSGGLIQSCLPELEDDERELLMSNLCENCFDEITDDE